MMTLPHNDGGGTFRLLLYAQNEAFETRLVCAALSYTL